MSRRLRGTPFCWGGVIVSRCLRCIPFSVLGWVSCPDSSTVFLFRCEGHRIQLFPRYHFSVGGEAWYSDVPAVSLFRWGGAPSFDVPAVSLFPLGGGHRIPMFFSVGGGIVSRCLPGIPFFRLGGIIVFLCSRGVSFPSWGGHLFGCSRGPFSVEGWASYSDVPAVSFFRWGGHRVPMSPQHTLFACGAISCPDVSAVSLFRVCGGRVPMCPRYPLFR